MAGLYIQPTIKRYYFATCVSITVERSAEEEGSQEGKTIRRVDGISFKLAQHLAHKELHLFSRNHIWAELIFPTLTPCLKFHEGEANLVPLCALPRRSVCNSHPPRPINVTRAVVIAPPSPLLSHRCHPADTSSADIPLVRRRVMGLKASHKTSFLPSELFTPSSRPPPSAEKHPNMMSHHTQEA